MTQQQLLEYFVEEIDLRTAEALELLAPGKIYINTSKADLGECLSKVVFNAVTLSILRELQVIVEHETDGVRAVAECMRGLSNIRDRIESQGSLYSDIIMWVTKDLNDGLIEVLSPTSVEEVEADTDPEISDLMK